MSKSSRPGINGGNLRIALRHPSLLLALAKGADSQELQRRFAKMTLFEEMYSLLERTRDAARSIGPLPSSAKDRLDALGEICSRLARSDTGRRGDAYYMALYLLVRQLRPTSVVETGVWWGSSSLFMLQAMEDNGAGTLYSVDQPNMSYTCSEADSHADIIPSADDTGSMVPHRLRGRWRLLLGKSREKLPPLLSELGKVDIFIHDSEHVDETMTFEYSLAWEHLKPDGLLMSDDTDWNDAFSRFTASKSAVSLEIEKYGQNRFGVALK